MRARRLTLGALLAAGLWAAAPAGQEAPAPAQAVEGEILVRFRSGTPQARRNAALAAVNGRRGRRVEALNTEQVRLPRGRRAEDAMAALRANLDVAATQPNYIRRIASDPPPNDLFWVFDTTYGFYGIKKIQAHQVWNAYSTGSNAVVVADIDTGVKYTHPDLAANMWVNPGEIPGNGVDDDGNGYVDDVHGINALTGSGDPMDDHGHGTHTAGTFGAVGNNHAGGNGNGTATVGVNWTVRILACKFLDANGSGNDLDAIECFTYITALKNRGVNVRVSNNSWGGYRGPGAPEPPLLKAAIDAAGAAGILNVFAAGNGGTDRIGDNTDLTPHDPSSFTSPSIVSVASADSADLRASTSNFGAVSVDLAAPGVSIVSTAKGTDVGCIGLSVTSNCAYTRLSGTSMATPHVAGAAALLLAQSPDVPVAALKSLLLDGVDPIPAWSGVVATGGRLNAFNAATALAANTPPSVSLTSPASGATFVAPATLNLAATASDPGGGIAKVEFFAGTTLLGTDTTSPYAITSMNVPAGAYVLTARATDTLGAVATSAGVTVVIFPTNVPAATLSASSLTYSKRLVGTISAPQVVTVTNLGPGPLVFGSFNGQPPAPAFSAGSDFQGTTNCPLGAGGPEGPPLQQGASCELSFVFAPVATGPRAGALTIVTNAASSPHIINLSGDAFVVDEATVSQAVEAGGTRLLDLQQADGGWYFGAADTGCGLGTGVSCANTLGVTALGVLAAYERTGDPTLLASAIATGQRLVAAHAAAPATPPYSQDLEFLVALGAATANPIYDTTASLWFQTILDAHPVAADRVDWALARRDAQGLRTLAVWDLASLIRMAKAVGQADYALAAAARIVEREADWQDLDPTHRWDQCAVSAGCGLADNPRAFEHTLLGMGSLLWAVHDLQGLDDQIDGYAAYLLSRQDAEGSWNLGDAQTSAYIALGLAAVGGPGPDDAVRGAAAFFIGSQLPSKGWPYYVVDEFVGGEYSMVNAEVLRAIATLYGTPAGAGVTVAPSQLATVTFDAVSAPGETRVVARHNTAGTRVPRGYTLAGGLSYDAHTTAGVSGGATVCVAVPWESMSGVFGEAPRKGVPYDEGVPYETGVPYVRLLRAEGGAFVDRTILDGPLAPSAASRRVCATGPGLGAFAVAVAAPEAPDTTPPALRLTLTPTVLWPPNNRLVNVAATIEVEDDTDPAPAITLVSITSSDDRRAHRRRPDIVGANAGTDDRAFQLRAERDPRGGERVYTIVYRATDRAGKTTEAVAEVVVPGGHR